MHCVVKGSVKDVKDSSAPRGLLPDAIPNDEPYRSLWAAVLGMAIMDLLGAEEKGLELWFASEDANPMSFAWICGVLDLDPHQVRLRMLKCDASALQAMRKLGRYAQPQPAPERLLRADPAARVIGSSSVRLHAAASTAISR